MKTKDMKIIAHLRQNARMPLTKMSRKTHIPVSTLFDNLKAKEKSIIRKHTSLLNFSKLGYDARANIALKVDRDDKENLLKQLKMANEVNSLYKINNGFDFMIEGIFKNVREMESFIENLENKFKITDKKFFFIIEDLKREEFMGNPNLIN